MNHNLTDMLKQSETDSDSEVLKSHSKSQTTPVSQGNNLPEQTNKTLTMEDLFPQMRQMTTSISKLTEDNKKLWEENNRMKKQYEQDISKLQLENNRLPSLYKKKC
jgi:hypothetical protein